MRIDLLHLLVKQTRSNEIKQKRPPYLVLFGGVPFSVEFLVLDENMYSFMLNLPVNSVH